MSGVTTSGVSVGMRYRDDGEPFAVLQIVKDWQVVCQVPLGVHEAQDLAVSLWDQAERVRVMQGEAL